MTDQEPPPLGETKSDRIGRGIAAAAGMVPVVGPAIQFAITELLPDARLTRIEAFLLHLQKRIDQARFEAAVQEPEGLDLFEEGLWQSARALSDDRRRYIAELVASGMAEDAAKQEQTRHFLRLLGQIGDSQVVILTSYQNRYKVLNGPEANAFRELHKHVLGPFISVSGKDTVRAAHNEALKRHLSSLGLLAVVEEAGNGMQKRPTDKAKYALTPQGRLFLEYLGLHQDGP